MLVEGNFSTAHQFARADLFGQALRYVFHDAGEFDLNTGDLFGPDGCISDTGSNNGIKESESLVESVMEPIWQLVCDRMSRADFFVLFAKLVIEEADTTGTIDIPYQYGRRHSTDCSGGAGRLPSAQFGLLDLNNFFVGKMGLSINDAVLLLASHTLGHMHLRHSGYGVPQAQANTNLIINAWDFTPTVFDNQYFLSIVFPPWLNERIEDPSPRNMWTTGSGKVLLNVDMALGYDIDMASSDDCFQCGDQTEICGLDGRFFQCTAAGVTGERFVSAGTSVIFDLVERYMQNNARFLSDYPLAFERMVSVGYADGVLAPLPSPLTTTCQAILLPQQNFTTSSQTPSAVSTRTPSGVPTTAPSATPGSGATVVPTTIPITTNSTAQPTTAVPSAQPSFVPSKGPSNADLLG